MPAFDWQTAATLLALAWALFYVARAARRTLIARRTTPGCGSCGSCPSNKEPTTIVTIDRLNGSS
jgi:hypothetical protein